jgi:hypothetical protein
MPMASKKCCQCIPAKIHGNTLFSQENELQNPRETADSVAIEDCLTVIGVTVIT